MDTIHDLGGRQGFGAIDVDEPEEAFHEPWEARMFGIRRAMSRPADWSLDWFRHCRELIEPTDYLSRPYFDQWLQAYAAMIANSGVATIEELASGKAKTPVSGLPPPMTAADVGGARRGNPSFAREIDEAPVFNVGDSVRVKIHGAPGHTRLPAYARGRRGIVEAHHGAHVFPDANAHGEERAAPLYTVGFDMAELWPEAQGRRERVFLNMWESYLERG
ncbi:MAG: nitrile hydratase subunit beta [Rhodospirillales bacterium]|jgi:nitrile hydratase|nr:nitrile hydratase subunit beta [Rhodospirillales bacterium]